MEAYSLRGIIICSTSICFITAVTPFSPYGLAETFLPRRPEALVDTVDSPAAGSLDSKSETADEAQPFFPLPLKISHRGWIITGEIILGDFIIDCNAFCAYQGHHGDSQALWMVSGSVFVHCGIRK
jgi:hypothetical protein